jgi:heat shock protein HslJ
VKKQIVGFMVFALLALALPGGSMAQGPIACERTYVVQPGDWLAAIAARTYGDPWAYPSIVYATNDAALRGEGFQAISDPYLIEPGWVLCLPAAETVREAASVNTLRNLTYPSEWTASKAAPLTDGEYSESAAPGSATKTVVKLHERMAFGYHPDGQQLAAVVLVTDPGGSGTFYDLAVLLFRAGEPQHVASASLGDRVRIESLAIVNGEIVVRMIAQGPDDPMCCPTQRVVERYALQGDRLERTSSQVLSGTPDLVGTTWEWERFLGGDDSAIEVADPTRYTLTLHAEGTYRLQADCNVAGGAYTLDAAHLTLHPGPTTLAECAPGSLYDTFLARLGDVRTYVMDEGKLVLNLWADAGDMFFREASPAAATPLEGALWRLASYVNDQGTLVQVLPDAQITIQFQEGQVAGSAGCNRYFASYQLDGDRLTVGPTGTTMMACQAEVSEQERLYLAALENAASVRIVEDRLELVDAQGSTVLAFDRDVPAPLVGTTWKLVSVHDGASALVSALSGTEITALFGDDGTVSGSAGCNNYTASYQTDQEALTFGPAATTRKACAAPEGVMEQESAYLAALASTATYRIEGDGLELLDAEGTRMATFVVGE